MAMTKLMAAGLDVDELEFMDPDDRAEALEEAGKWKQLLLSA